MIMAVHLVHYLLSCGDNIIIYYYIFIGFNHVLSILLRVFTVLLYQTHTASQ